MRNAQMLMVATGFAIACGGDEKTAGKDLASAASGEAARFAVAAAPMAAPGAGVAPVAAFYAKQKLIRTADLRVQVRDVSVTLKSIDSIALSSQALVANSHTQGQADGKRTATVVLRVPAGQFGDLLKALRGLGTLQNESVAAEDVTKAYADLETRLLVKQQTVTRLRGLMENRTAKLSEVLEVERELGREVAELEQMKGEQRFYDQQIALSTVTLALLERAPSQIGQATKPIAEALHDSLEILGKSIGTVVYVTVALVPWILVGCAVASLIVVVRRRTLPKAVVTAPPA